MNEKENVLGAVGNSPPDNSFSVRQPEGDFRTDKEFGLDSREALRLSTLRTEELTTGEQLAATIRQNFYLEPLTPEQKVILGEVTPRQDMVLVEISGLPGSGKHTIQQEAERHLLEKVGPAGVFTEKMVREIPGHTAKDKVREILSAADLATDPFAFQTEIFTRMGMGAIYATVFKDSKAPWFVNTRGPLSAFQLMVHSLDKNTESNGGHLWRYVEAYGLEDLILTSRTLTELAAELTEDAYRTGMDTLAGLANMEQVRYMRSLITTPVPITFICGLPINECMRNIANPNDPRKQERPFGSNAWRQEDLVTMRLIHALMLRTAPDIFFEINTTKADDFATYEALKVINNAALIAQNYVVKMENPLRGMRL